MTSRYKYTNRTFRCMTELDEQDKPLLSMHAIRAKSQNSATGIKKERSRLRELVQYCAVQHKENCYDGRVQSATSTSGFNCKSALQRHKQTSTKSRASTIRTNNGIAVPKSAAKKNPSSRYKCNGHNCNQRLKILSTTFVENDDEDVAYMCVCGEFICCHECWHDWGQFCKGSCGRYYCNSKCATDFFGNAQDGHYCSVECTKKDPSIYEKYKNYRRDYKDNGFAKDPELERQEISLDRKSGHRRCRGITRDGRRCEITSRVPYESALSLKQGDCFCTHHGGRASDCFLEEDFDSEETESDNLDYEYYYGYVDDCYSD
jgi:hypothetical protein